MFFQPEAATSSFASGDMFDFISAILSGKIAFMQAPVGADEIIGADEAALVLNHRNNTQIKQFS